MLRTQPHNSDEAVDIRTLMEFRMDMKKTLATWSSFYVVIETVPPTSSMISTVSPCSLSTLSHRINPSRGEDTKFSHARMNWLEPKGKRGKEEGWKKRVQEKRRRREEGDRQTDRQRRIKSG